MSRKTPQTLPDAAGLHDKVAAALNEGPTAALLAFDLDGLHPVNLSLGHEVGDQVIAAALDTLSEAARGERWVLARPGGDAFTLLAPKVTVEAAFLRADRLRQAVNQATGRVLPDGTSCTVSVGVAGAPRDAKSADELVKKADLALYSAKEQGGDTVALTPGEDMVLRSSYYPSAQLARLRTLAERLKVKESVLLRDALDDLLRKYDQRT